MVFNNELSNEGWSQNPMTNCVTLNPSNDKMHYDASKCGNSVGICKKRIGR